MVKKDAIIIFGDTFTFPDGNAATNRVHTFAKGYSELGIKAIVICFRNDYMENNIGTFQDIDYYYPFNQTRRSNSFLKRRFVKLAKYFRTISIIRKLSNDYSVLAINLWTNRLLVQFFVYFLGRNIKSKIIHEHSEHPLRECKGKIQTQSGEIKSYFGTRLCDGIFCISNYLINFYLQRGVRNEKLLLVPSTVDTGRFRSTTVSPLSYDYILYCGSLTIQKDGVDILVDSFNHLSSSFPEIKLVLIGKGDIPEEEIAIKKRVAELGLTNRVVFLGQLGRMDVPAYICHAKVLALARPRSIVADAGFPSKLTEYLSSGKPVVVTRVGEIPFFLRDNEHAFLTEPGNALEFARRMADVLNNYEFAKSVGEKGKGLTDTVFNYRYQANRMIDFIRKLGN